jgi:SAM-dependent methyltransferase
MKKQRWESDAGLHSKDLYGQALVDYFNGDHSATMIMHRDDGQKVELPSKVFFQESTEFSRIEHMALDLCFGRILDIGAGAGPHSLVLQDRGLDVYAIDISTEVVEIMRKRGVKKAECYDVFKFHGGRFDTLLMLRHGIGMTGTITGLGMFLDHAHLLINPKGQLIFDSLDIRCTKDPDNLAYQESNKLKNRYIGEIHLQWEYKDQMGESWTWLQVDPETLSDEALKAGWFTEIIHQEPWGDFLAKLAEK